MSAIGPRKAWKISSWNINGYNSKLLGNKLCDVDFLNEIEGRDIVGLCETHIHESILDKLAIPGYVRVAYKNKQLKTKMNKGHGGLAVFVKEHLLRYVVPQINKNEDSIWIKIKKEILDRKEDIFLATVYINPHKSNNADALRIHNLYEEILDFKRKGHIIIQGDLNARTNTERDFILPDIFENENHLLSTIELPNRNSQDNVKTDNRGNEILEVCKSLGLSIINGRKPGDIYGAYTSIQWNGNSVVDYVISNRELFESIPTMRIGRFIPWISDHCAVHFQIAINEVKNSTKTFEKKGEMHTENFFWGENSSDKFTEALRESEIELNELNEINITDSAEIISKFTDTIRNISIKAGLKRKVVRNIRRKNDPSWFDKECREKKNELRHQGNLVKRQPNCIEHRMKLFERKKMFQNSSEEKKDYV